MKRSFQIIIVTCLLVFLLTAVNKAQAGEKGEIGFSAGSGFYQVVDDRRKNGYNLNLSLNYALDEKDRAVLYFEHLNIDNSGEVLQTSAGDVKVRTDITAEIGEFRLMRDIITDILDVGIGLGAARMEVVSKPDQDMIGPEALSLARDKTTVPVVDVLGRITALNKLGKRSAAKIYLDLGYRFLDIDDLDISRSIGISGGAVDVLGDVTIDDLSGFFANIGLAVGF